MANGTVYRRDDRKKPWIAHVSWHGGDRRRQSKRSYWTEKEAQQALAETIDSHRRRHFVAPTAGQRLRRDVDQSLRRAAEVGSSPPTTPCSKSFTSPSTTSATTEAENSAATPKAGNKH